MSVDPNERRIQDEVEHHLEELQSRLEAEGMSREEARAEARRRFGDPEKVERETRAVAGPAARGLAGGLWGEIRQVLRGLRRAPTFGGSIVVTLGLALGATIAMSSVVWDVILRPLELRDPGSLVMLVERMPENGIERSPTSEGTFHDWQRELETVEEIAAFEWVSRTLEDPERPEELLALQVTGSLSGTMGITPALGRALTFADEVVGAPATTLMISHALWARRFGSDPDVVGRTIPVDGVQREIVGVLPRRVELVGTDADLWVPSAHEPRDATNRGGRILHVVARRAPGASTEAVAGEVAALTERIAETYPVSARGWTATAVPVETYLLGDVRSRIRVAVVAVALLLLVASVNVANLLLVRAADSRRENAVRAALGAGRARLVRMRLVESAVLGLLGGGAGLGLAWALQRWLASAPGVTLPRALDPSLPPVAVAFGLGLALAVGLSVGVLPAIRGAEAAVGSLGRGTAGGGLSARSRHALVVVQLGVTMVLLIGAGLLVRTVSALRAVDPGFDPTTPVAARVDVDDNRYPTSADVRIYHDRLLERVRAIPGVRAAGLTSALPMDPVAANFDLPTRTDPATGWGEAAQVDFRIVSPGVMEALEFRLLEGRFFDRTDGEGALTAVVNRSLAEAFWPGESALGKEIQNVWRQDQFATVVGVVEDTRFYGPDQESRPELFFSNAQVAWSFMTVVADGTGTSAALLARLERAITEIDPRMPAQEVFAVSSLVDATVSTERFYALLLGGFAALALLLAAAGVYGVLAYAVRLRTREMGVRLALGATRDQVVGMILRSGVGLGLLGVGLGLVAAVPATRFVAGMLFGVEPLDPVTIGGVAVLLVGVAAVACLSPALRAGRLQPARVLREE